MTLPYNKFPFSLYKNCQPFGWQFSFSYAAVFSLV